MPCTSCHSTHQRAFDAELNIHVSGDGKRLDEPGLLLFPVLQICLECGLTEFVIHRSELLVLENSGRASA